MISIERLLYTVLLAVSIGFVPVVIMTVLIMAGIFLIEMYWEGVLLLVLMCALANIPLVFVLIVLALVSMVVVVRTKVVSIE